MGLCRGNLGNLMQHWVQSEVLVELTAQLGGQAAHLLFATTHSMAPWSVPRPLDGPAQDYSRPRFDGARTRLVREDASVYETAWAALSCRDGLPYPSSAAFALRLWEGPLSLLLCESSPIVADEIRGWLALAEIRARLSSAPDNELHEGDWRDRFRSGITPPDAVHAVFVEMDPMRFEHQGRDRCRRDNRGVLFVEDLELVAALSAISIPVVVQISSFSADNNNPHRLVEPAITTRLVQAGFELRGRVEADGNMISLVYSRGVALWQSHAPLGPRFAAWARGV